MSDFLNMSLKKRIILIVLVVLLAGVTITAVVLFGPTPMHFDWNELYDVESEVALLEAGAEGNPFSDAPALVKTEHPDSDWKVLQFTDLHLSHKNYAGNNNEITLQKYIETIQREKPDFVVLTGDIVTSSGGRARAIQFAEIMERLGVYWAYNLGNHEGDEFYKLSRKELMSIIEQYPHCLSEGSVKKTADGTEVWGIGNFTVNLLNGSHEVVQSLIFMDSGDAISDADAKQLGVKKGSYDYLKDDQIQWYSEQIEKVTEGFTKTVKTMLFIHIPLIQQHNVEYIDLTADSDDVKDGWTAETPKAGYRYLEGADAVDHDGHLVGKVAVKDGWNVIAGTANYEKVSSSKVDSGMYERMKELRNYVNGLFCGHDHINNSILYEDYDSATESPIYLCYGITGGYDAYNLYKKNKTDNPDNWMRGYSVITIHGSGTFDYTGVSWDADECWKASPYIVNGEVADAE